LVANNQAILVNLQGTVQDLSNNLDTLSAFMIAQSKRQVVANGGALEKKVGKAVIGLGQIIAPQPFRIIMSVYDLVIGLKTWVKK
jgi:hypothetical protein